MPMYVHHMFTVSIKARRKLDSPGTRIIDGCKQPCGCQKLNPELLK